MERGEGSPNNQNDILLHRDAPRRDREVKEISYRGRCVYVCVCVCVKVRKRGELGLGQFPSTWVDI